MTIVAFQKEVSLKSLVYLGKRLLDRLKTEHLMSINRKKKFKRILVEGEKFKLTKAAFK